MRAYWFRSNGMVLEEFGWFGEICGRKTLFRMKKEADQARFKGTQTVDRVGTAAPAPPRL